MQAPRSIRLAISIFALSFALMGHADIVVDTANDADNGSDGVCSLREAITAVNNQADYHECTDPDVHWSTVTFAIPGNALHTIALSSAMPAITRPVTINAMTQSGTVCAPVPNLRVQITNPANLSSDGLDLNAGSDGSSIYGLAISGFAAGAGLAVNSGSATIGCVISGMDATGSTAAPNSYGVYVIGNNATIGVATANAWLPNLISGNSGSLGTTNIYVGGNNALIAGNYIGVDHTGLSPLPTGYGIQIFGASGVHIGVGINGGPAAHQRNIIGVASTLANSSSVDIEADAATTNLVIAGNYIGVGADGHTVLPIESGVGINLFQSTGTLIGCNGRGVWEDCRNVIVVPVSETAQNLPIEASASNPGLAIVSNFINVAANGVTSLAGPSTNTNAITLVSDALVARNVISGGMGVGIFLLPPNDHSPTAVFLNPAPAGPGGATLNSNDNCLPDTTSAGVDVLLYGTATAASTTFTFNWWGVANGPKPTGDGASAAANVITTPFFTKPPIYCGFDRIFIDGFDG